MPVLLFGQVMRPFYDNDRIAYVTFEALNKLFPQYRLFSRPHGLSERMLLVELQIRD